MTEQFRQGDVLLTRIEELPDGLHPAARAAGRIVLAEGEATGHAHAVSDAGAELLEGWGTRVLRVVGEPATLLHEEHNAIVLRPGLYLVTRQREYDPDASRTVAD